MSPPLKYWKLLLISPADGVACTVLIIPADLFMGHIYLQYILLLFTLYHGTLLGSMYQKIKLQRLNKPTDKTKNLLSLHNSPRPLKI